MPIKVLGPKLVSRIAAGEVVERPASVVKELVENSLDAGASQISIEARGGGVSLIRVVDNGAGIPSGEVELAFDRYATSKIAGLDDLDSILTLGFRGEALPSIAAVAEVDIVTCAARETTGAHLSLRDGRVVGRESEGRSQGTTVTVRNLFRRVPARLKFLRSPATENSHIANIVTRYAFAFPEVKFVLLIDGRGALSTPGSGRLIDSIIEIYGSEVAQNMLEIERGRWEGRAAASSLLVTGMVGSPAIGRASRDYLNLFVNHRWINSRLLAWAVEEAYHGLLMKGKHPVAVIDIILSPQEVDINIHPGKTEVKFQQERAIFSAVQKAVRQALVKLTPVPQVEEVATAYEAPSLLKQGFEVPIGGNVGVTPAPTVAAQTTTATLPVLRVLGQISASYIIAEGPDGLYLIDQHAAHERVLFEQIVEQRSRQEVEVQGLLEPATFEVSPQQEQVLRARYKDLAGFGFSIEPFGEKTFLVRSVPALLSQKDWAGMVRGLLGSEGNEGDWTEKVAVSMACHSAVKAGQILAEDEMRELVRKLEQASLPHTCPHGRPTMIHLSLGQLRSEFGRR